MPKLPLGKPAPFQLRGPFMARVWLLVAVTIVGIQMIFVVNLLVKKDNLDPLGNAPQPTEAEAAPIPALRRWEERNIVDADEETARQSGAKHREEEEVDKSAETKSQSEFNGNHIVPPVTVSPAPSGNSQIFDTLQSLVMNSFHRHGAPGTSGTGPSAPLQLNQLLPLVAMLPDLGGPNMETLVQVDWRAYTPLLDKLQAFTEFCSDVFARTVAEMKTRYPEKAQLPAFVSAVAMKSFFRIFALEDTQDMFLQLLDETAGLLDALGMTNLVTDLLSGHLYEKMLSTGGGQVNAASGMSGGLAAIFMSAAQHSLASTTSTTAAPHAGKDYPDQESEGEDMDNSPAFVSNEQFEGIMELYDSMFRDDESRNATSAKLELSGRVFLQAWYESMRRYGRERGKLVGKPLTPADFANYMEAIEVPFSNIIDFAYPLHRPCPADKELTLVAVVSRSRDADRRQAVRQTWGRAGAAPVKVVFVVSDRPELRAQLQAESEQYGDVVTVDVPETYEYVMRRTLAVLDWATRHCTAATYIFKTTDQVYLNISLLMDQVEFARKAATTEAQKDPVQLVGNLVRSAPAQRNPLRLNHLFYDEYPFDALPAHLAGFGYLLSREYAKQAIAVAKDFPLMRTDDLAVTGILAAKLKVTPHPFQNDQTVQALTAAQLDQDKEGLGTMLCAAKTNTLMFGQQLTAPEMLRVHSVLAACSGR